MPESHGSYDIAIAGAGIGGLTLALTLAREGWTIALLERDLTPHQLPRPEILWDPTLALLDRTGIGSRIRRKTATPLRRFSVWDASTGNRCLLFSEDDFARAGTQAWATDPAATRKLILNAALATGNVTLLQGAHATGLIRKDARIRGLELTLGGEPGTVEAPLVIGDDGPGSIVRHSAEIPLDAMAFPVTLVSALAPKPKTLPENVARAYIDPRNFRENVPGALIVPVNRAQVALVIAVRPEEYEPLTKNTDNFERHVAHLIFPYLDLEMPHPFPEAFAHTTPQYGHAERYSTPGVALIGDAAHPVSPVGGQGANMAVGDAVALADTLVAQARPGQSPGRDALATYEAMRRGPNERSLALSAHAARAIGTAWHSPWSARILPVALRFFDDAPGRQARLLQRLSESAVSAIAPGIHADAR